MPSHFLGAIIAAIIFKVLFPSTELFGAEGVVSESSETSLILRGCIDTVVSFFYICLLRILPELIVVNKLSIIYWNLSVLPLVLVSIHDPGIQCKSNHGLLLYYIGNTFNPATLYALQFVHSETFFSLSYFLKVIILLLYLETN